MASIVDDRGYNQGFVPSEALDVRTNRRCQAMIDVMDFSKPRKIIELGCGTGALSDLLASKTKADVIGTDLCKPFVEKARLDYKRPNLSYDLLDLNDVAQIEKFSEQFDYVVGNGILHHIYHDLDLLLPKLRMLLKPGGRMIFWEPNLLNPYVALIFKVSFLRKKAKLEPDEMAFTGKFIQKKLVSAGFTHVTAETKDFLLPNTPNWLISPVVKVGSHLENYAISKWSAQSLFICAEKEVRTN